MNTNEIIDHAAPEYLVKLGGLEFLDRMIGLFLTHPLRLLDDAESALAAGQTEPATRAGHSLKTSASQIGALHLRDVALKLEKAGADMPPQERARLLQDVRSAYNEACEGLRAYRRSLSP